MPILWLKLLMDKSVCQALLPYLFVCITCNNSDRGNIFKMTTCLYGMAEITFIALPFPLVTKTSMRVLCLSTRVWLLRARNYIYFESPGIFMVHSRHLIIDWVKECMKTVHFLFCGEYLVKYILKLLL